ncbi:hypothetical protein CDAR_446501, partial [Caerostris darwini]
VQETMMLKHFHDGLPFSPQPLNFLVIKFQTFHVTTTQSGESCLADLMPVDCNDKPGRLPL